MTMPSGLYYCNFGDGGVILAWDDRSGCFWAPGDKDRAGDPWGFITSADDGSDVYAAWDGIARAYRVCTVRRHWPHAGLIGPNRIRNRDRAFSEIAALRAQGKPWGHLTRPNRETVKVPRGAVKGTLRVIHGSGTFEVEVISRVR